MKTTRQILQLKEVVMTKIIKEIIIMLLVALAGMLLFAVIFYEYIPNRKVVPEVSQYSASEKIKEYGPVLEQHITDVKCSILLESHPVTVNYNQEGEIVYPLQEITKEVSNKAYKAVLVGVSTGGPGTLATLIKGIGRHYPLPILITQHIDS